MKRTRLEELLFCEDDRPMTRAEAEDVLSVVTRRLAEGCGLELEHALDALGDSFEGSALRGLIVARRAPDPGSAFDCTWAGVVSATDGTDDGRIAYGAFLFPFVGDQRLVPVNRAPGEAGCFRYVWVRLVDGHVVFEDLGWQEDEWAEWDHVTSPRDLLSDGPR